MKLTILAVTLLVMVIICAQQATAITKVIVDNTGSSGGAISAGSLWLAYQFRMPNSGGPYYLVRLETSAIVATVPQIYVYTDSGTGMPQTAMQNLSVSVTSSPIPNSVLARATTCTTTYTANQLFWIVLLAAAGGAQWSTQNSQTMDYSGCNCGTIVTNSSYIGSGSPPTWTTPGNTVLWSKITLSYGTCDSSDSPSPSSSRTASITPTPSVTRSPSVTPSVSRTPSMSGSTTGTPSPSSTHSASPSSSASSSVSSTTSGSSSATITPSATPSPSTSRSASITASTSASATMAASSSSTVSPSQSVAASVESSPSTSSTRSILPSASPSASVTMLASPSSSRYASGSASPSPSMLASASSSPSASITPYVVAVFSANEPDFTVALVPPEAILTDTGNLTQAQVDSITLTRVAFGAVFSPDGTMTIANNTYTASSNTSWQYANGSASTTQTNTYSKPLVDSNGNTVGVTVRIDTQQDASAPTTIELAPGINTTIGAGAVKYSLYLERNGGDALARITHNGMFGWIASFNTSITPSNPVSDDYLTQQDGYITRYVWHRKDSRVQVQLPIVALVDGTPMNITADVWTTKTATIFSIYVRMYFPLFNNTLYYDPDLSVLFGTESSNTADTSNNSSNSDTVNIAWLIPVVVVVPCVLLMLGAMVLLIAGALGYWRRARRHQFMQKHTAADSYKSPMFDDAQL